MTTRIALPFTLGFKMSGMRRQGPPDPLPQTSQVRKNLFGPIDHEENLKFVQEELSKISQADCKRWNFDFQAEKPKEGRYNWEPVSGKVPQAYEMRAMSCTHPQTLPQPTPAAADLPKQGQQHVPAATALPQPTTTLPQPTTTLPQPTTAVQQPTITLQQPTTTPPQSTTTLAQSTTAPQPTTTLPQPTTARLPALLATETVPDAQPTLTTVATIALRPASTPASTQASTASTTARKRRREDRGGGPIKRQKQTTTITNTATTTTTTSTTTTTTTATTSTADKRPIQSSQQAPISAYMKIRRRGSTLPKTTKEAPPDLLKKSRSSPPSPSPSPSS
ncbi:mucin-2-like [Scylla paramamosain]|uniref:mucin-2-like n=1 Tax=Scylla paramamosain TaxID=85552 RepID=UPI003083A26C